ncbi:hypothetical protein LBMAG42_12820 [Deltaproteobacteria bacterium]|nr:hypothetical protein LBMAG42_12820 [Deltaproteobacteria bacterium]
MRAAFCLLLFAFACTPTTTVIEGGGNDDTSANANDTGDTGSNDTGDTDTATDTGKDTDTDPGPDLSEGEYEGTMEGVMEAQWGDSDCSGDVRFSIDGKGKIDGTASCNFEGGGNGMGDFDGDLSGDEKNGKVSLIWAIDYGRDTWDIDGAGSYAEGVVEAEVSYDEDWGAFVGEIYAERQ